MIFLRPWFLLGLILPFLFKKVLNKSSGLNPWAKYIDKKLLNALTIKNKVPFQKNTLSKLGLILWSIGMLALSGPAWDKIPVPATQSKTNTVIVMDLKSNMPPQELLQRHIQFYDLLRLLKDNRVGLVVFGTHQGYTAMPLTPDIKLLENLIPSLVPSILPEESTNPMAGLKEAEKMLNQTGGKGRIIYMGNEKNMSSKYPLIYLNTNNNLNEIATDLTEENLALSVSDEWNKNADIWYDRGIWLALICLIPAALCFRKNVLFLWLILCFTFPAKADLFQREDQKAYHIDQKGIQAFQKKDYTGAEQFFKKSKNPYNQGNALAYQGKIQEAIQAYQEALKLNPNDTDAQFNKEYLEKQLPPPEQKQNQQDQQNQQNQENQQKDSQQNQDNENNQENQDQEAQKSDEKNDQNTASDNEKEEKAQPSEQNQEMQPTQEETQKELEQALEEEEKEDQFNQEEQQILNRLNRDPARVLRYRINLQHLKG